MINVLLAGILALALNLVYFVMVSVITGLLFMVGWNHSMTTAFHMPELGYVQAYCLMFLCCVVGGAFKSNVQVSR